MPFARWFRPVSVGGLLVALLTAPAVAGLPIDDPKPNRPDSPAGFQPKEVVFSATVEPAEARPGDLVTYTLTARLEDSWHLYAHAEEIPEGVFVIPTRFEFFADGGLEPADEKGWTPTERPTASDPDSDVLTFPYHEGTISWKQSLRVPDDATPGQVELQTQVFFQLCNDVLCKPPTRRTITAAPLTIVADDSQALRDRPAVSPLAGLFGPLLVSPPQDDAGVLVYDYFEDEVTWSLPLTLPADAQPGERSIRTQIQFQICDPKSCKPPVRVTLPAVALTVLEGDGSTPASESDESESDEAEAEPELRDSPVLFQPKEAKFSTSIEPADARPGETVNYRVHVSLDPTWHIYDLGETIPEGVAATPTRFDLFGLDGLEPSGEWSADREPHKPEGAFGTSESASADSESVADSSESASETVATGSGVATGELAEKLDQGLLAFMAWSALGGLIALLMPCVWPMVPITVNFFVKQGQLRKDSSTTGLAITYCLAIIGVFTLVGVLFSAFFGAASLSQLANAAWLNFLVAGLFIAFGLSLLGVFEIRLPTSLLNASAQGEAKGGLVGVIFMALTLTITSFTCTFPVVGALLVLAAGGSYIYPVIGLATFATVLALPFFLLALAPGLMQNLPRSGDWMNAVKVVGGLIEIGAAFKFLNTAEISLGANPEDAWLDAQVLMAAWVIIAAVCGLYLLGMFRTSHDHGEVQVGAGRLLFGTFFLGLALYFSPALFGYPPKSKLYDRLVVGLLPADADEMDMLVQMRKLGLSGGGGGGSGGGMIVADADETDPVRRARNFHGVWWGLSYDAAVEQSKATGKPILIDFTGVNCANCRLMEKSVIPRPEVVQRLDQFIPVQLYTDRVPVDGLTPDEKFDLAEQNLMLEVELTQQQVSPLYVVLTPDEELVVSPRGGYIEPAEFTAYLDRALSAYNDLGPRTADSGE